MDGEKRPELFEVGHLGPWCQEGGISRYRRDHLWGRVWGRVPAPHAYIQMTYSAHVWGLSLHCLFDSRFILLLPLSESQIHGHLCNLMQSAPLIWGDEFRDLQWWETEEDEGGSKLRASPDSPQIHYKFIRICNNPTEQLLKDSRRPQTSKKASQSP